MKNLHWFGLLLALVVAPSYGQEPESDLNGAEDVVEGVVSQELNNSTEAAAERYNAELEEKFQAQLSQQWDLAPAPTVELQVSAR